jgi:hypothetical protein
MLDEDDLPSATDIYRQHRGGLQPELINFTLDSSDEVSMWKLDGPYLELIAFGCRYPPLLLPPTVLTRVLRCSSVRHITPPLLPRLLR